MRRDEAIHAGLSDADAATVFMDRARRAQQLCARRGKRDERSRVNPEHSMSIKKGKLQVHEHDDESTCKSLSY